MNMYKAVVNFLAGASFLVWGASKAVLAVVMYLNADLLPANGTTLAALVGMFLTGSMYVGFGAYLIWRGTRRVRSSKTVQVRPA